ncbi:hypothetical protein OSB04_005154 [Centaurea solstitialis]|uniref:Jasmonate O-methyltransferase n=1 Tax=Centaurea solstitialis TaxID=347529 RepID=A0AA38TFG0_9ASTR|nr:hypothetical protein OSB04_005154 [Centaurea solstitialis]
MQVFHMNKGAGKTSYARNSLTQRKIISINSSMVESAIVAILCEIEPTSMGVADLGCSSGPNSLIVVSQIVHIVQAASHRMGRVVPELRVSLNDLPDNDFNYVFQSLPELYKKLKQDCGIEGNYYIWGVPGSFYGRLFPSHSLHFVHSSTSLHWLSKVPSGLELSVGIHLNKENIYIAKNSSPGVVKAYQQQFHEDFSLFLRSRAKEVIAKGRRGADEDFYHWEFLAHALMSMAIDGLVEKESIDSFNIPYYAPSIEEVQDEVEKEGSFVISCVEVFEIEYDDGDSSDLKESRGTRVTKSIRAVVEPMIESHFHLGEETMDELFMRCAKIVNDDKNRFQFTSLLISVVRKG